MKAKIAGGTFFFLSSPQATCDLRNTQVTFSARTTAVRGASHASVLLLAPQTQVSLNEEEEELG